jgi:hypothetical protein
MRRGAGSGATPHPGPPVDQAVTPALAQATRRALNFAFSSTTSSSSSTTVGVVVSATVTAPFGVGSVPEVGVMVRAAMAAAFTWISLDADLVGSRPVGEGVPDVLLRAC